MAELPTGTLTFFFSDIEGSTRLLEALGEEYDGILEHHRRIIRDAFAGRGGVEIGTEGDSFFAVFPTATGALAAAIDVQRAIAAEPWPRDVDLRVRIGLHSGEARVAADDYVGLDVHRAARIMEAAHGGQVVLGETTRALVQRGLVDGVALRDLGHHRLRDLSGRERLFQVLAPGLATDFPPPRTLDAIPNNLPTQLSSFLGREREIADVIDRLAAVRLLTLTGPGGTGKTRLSLEVAGRLLERFADGVFFVRLASIGEPSLVPATIAHQLGLAERGGADPIQALAAHLAGRETLLVIDNFEQVMPAATVVGELLAAGPRLKVIVTSRATLHVYGEHEYPVPPLGLPDPWRLPDSAALTEYESVALFVERAAAVKPGFAVTDANARAIAEICVRLDGLPLAIELAAARVRILTPQAILARLGRSLDLLASGARDLPDRQRTLRGAIGWSYEMLEEPDRTLFGDLSVFVGGASLSAIEAVCGDLLEGDLLGALDSLVEKSLLRQSDGDEGESRFSMLATIREYAVERSAESGRQEQVRERHAVWFADLAEAAAPQFVSRERRPWLDRIEADHDNIRAALAWATGSGRAELALRLVAALWRFWQIRGYLAEGHDRTLNVLAMEGLDEHPRLLLNALDAAGGLAYWRGRLPAAREAYGRALEWARRLGDRRVEAEQLYNLSFVDSIALEADRDPNGLERASRLVEESLAIFTELGDEPGRGKTAWQLSNLELLVELPEAAEARAEEALAVFSRLDDRFMMGWTHWGLSAALYRQGRYAATLEHLEAALALLEEAQDVSGHVLILTGFSALAHRVGDVQRAARLAGAADALAQTTGTGIGRRIGENYLFDPEPLRTDPASAAAWAEGRAMTVEDALACARATVVPNELRDVPRPASQGGGG